MSCPQWVICWIVNNAMERIILGEGLRCKHEVRRRSPAQGVVMKINDNGGGFDPAATHSSTAGGGFGLINMSERIERQGGRLAIHSDSMGSVVEVTL